MQALLLFGHGKAPDQEMTAVEKIVHSLEEGQPTPPCQVTWGSTRVGLEVEGARGHVGKSPHCGFPRKKCVRQGKQAKQV